MICLVFQIIDWLKIVTIENAEFNEDEVVAESYEEESSEKGYQMCESLFSILSAVLIDSSITTYL